MHFFIHHPSFTLVFISNGTNFFRLLLNRLAVPIDSIFWVHSDSVLNNTCSHNYTYVISLKRSNTGWLHCWNSIFPRHESKPCYTTPFPPLPIHHHLKGTVQRDFRSTFFSLSNPPEPLTNGLKNWFWLRFRGVIRILGLNKLTVSGMIPLGDWLARVRYPGEPCFGEFCIDSPGYDTPGRLTLRGIIPWGDRKIWITRQILKQNKKYFNPSVSGPGWVNIWKKN